LIFIRCSRISPLIFPPTVYHGILTTSSVARERTTHLVWGSSKRKLEHVQTCLSTRVCFTQQPSDTLRPFRELNCRTGVLVWIRREHYASFSLFLQKAKRQSHPLQRCHLAVLCCTRCSTLSPKTRQARHEITYVERDTLRPDGPILIILGTKHFIITIKLLALFQYYIFGAVRDRLFVSINILMVTERLCQYTEVNTVLW
jgi:hypothetical protein